MLLLRRKTSVVAQVRGAESRVVCAQDETAEPRNGIAPTTRSDIKNVDVGVGGSDELELPGAAVGATKVCLIAGCCCFLRMFLQPAQPVDALSGVRWA